jgi:hypothetical protein
MSIWLDGVEQVTSALPTNIFDGTEHRLSFTWDNTNGGLKVYVDGVEEYSATGFQTGVTLQSGGTLNFGQEQDNLGGGFDSNQIFAGSMDDVRIFDDVRTAQEIADNWNTELSDPANEQGLVSNWQFDSENGGVVTDVAGTNDLSLVNGASISWGAQLTPTGPNLITNGSFENGSTGWTDVNGTGFDFSFSGEHGVTASDGSTYLDMESFSGNAKIEQAVAGLTSGSSYQLSFDAAGISGYNEIMEVYWNGALPDTIDPASSTMTTYTYTVTAGSGDGTDTVQFDEEGTLDMGGVALDNVQMYELAGPEGDTLSGGDGNDTLIGGAGADSLDGGAGTDTADYSDSASGIIADLAAGTGTGGDALGDTYTSIENVTGSDYNDTLTGDANANVLNGGAGNDTLNGGDGSDLFMFQMGGGTDTVNGGAGGGWTDTMLLQDASGGNNLGTYGVDWTITLSEGSITGSDANGFDLSADADGVITLSDGATVNFFDIERIDF